MKAKTIILVVTASLLLLAFTAVPARAGEKTTNYTGTVEFLSWVDPVPPVITPGGTIQEQFRIEWRFSTTDLRLTGIYVTAGKCTWPHEKPWPWGPCAGTWTLDVDDDQQPEWEGVITVNPRDDVLFWNGNGHGRDEYAGLHVTFKVTDGLMLAGQVTGN